MLKLMNRLGFLATVAEDDRIARTDLTTFESCQISRRYKVVFLEIPFNSASNDVICNDE